MSRTKTVVLTTVAIFATALAACSIVPPAPAKPVGEATAAEAIQALRQGGYVLVMRHGETEADAADTDPLHLDNCAQQRGLTDIGRLMHSGVAQLLEREQVSVSSVTASRYCRTVEAAQRMAEKLHVAKFTVTDDFAEGGQVVPPKENKRRAAALRSAVAAAPAPGTNALILTHRPNIMEAFGPEFFSIAEGEMAIFRPASNAAGYELVWRVKVNDFSAYAKHRGEQPTLSAAS